MAECRSPRVHVLTPSFKPVGGVLKIFDYARHFMEEGFEVVLYSRRKPQADDLLFSIPTAQWVAENLQHPWRTEEELRPHPQDYIFFSWPRQWLDVLEALPREFPPHNVIHIIQNTRHSNPEFIGGFARRLLYMPMTRIAINWDTLSAIDSFIPESSVSRVIPLGHDTNYFLQSRSGPFREPPRVAYTTWKSHLGDRLRELFSDHEFEFASITGPASWASLAELYSWADIFLGTPNEQEGFYLPGLEAMAAGAIVLVPDVGGNRDYCEFGSNCLPVEFEDVYSYAEALRSLRAMEGSEIRTLREEGWKTARSRSLERERRDLAGLLEDLEQRENVEFSQGFCRRWAVHRAPFRDSEPLLLVTGVPRSGTTLLARLCEGCPGTIPVIEPFAIQDFINSDRRSEDTLVLASRVSEVRRNIMDGVPVPTRGLADGAFSNFIEEPSENSGLRRDLGSWVTYAPLEPPQSDFLLVAKDVPIFSALLPELVGLVQIAATVRNPLAVLLSWSSVDLPVHYGTAPAAEWLSPWLARSLADPSLSMSERRLSLLGWWYRRLSSVRNRINIVKYERMVESPERTVMELTGQSVETGISQVHPRAISHYYCSVEQVSEAVDQLAYIKEDFSEFYSMAEVETLADSLTPI